MTFTFGAIKVPARPQHHAASYGTPGLAFTLMLYTVAFELLLKPIKLPISLNVPSPYGKYSMSGFSVTVRPPFLSIVTSRLQLYPEGEHSVNEEPGSANERTLNMLSKATPKRILLTMRFFGT